MLEALKKAYAHYGIDPSTYSDEYQHGDTFCPVCRAHYTTMAIPHCDLEEARAADMEAEGFESRFCFHCHHAYPKQVDRGAICPACDRKQARISNELLRKRSRRKVDHYAGYVEDGFGCVEKLPKWMDEWDGRPEETHDK